MDSERTVSTRNLTGVDAAFLYLERKELPLHIAAIFVFDGPIAFRKFVRRIDSTLHLMPRYRQVVVEPPFHLAYPRWEDDPHFDIRRHIHRVRVEAPGGEPELEDLAGRILSQVMDRSKPLWDIHVVEGMKDRRGAMILRVHHSAADGLAGAALLRLMLDPTPEGKAPGRRPPHKPVPAPAPSVMGAIASGIRSSLSHLITAEASMLDIARRWWDGSGLLQEVAPLLPEMVGAIERLPFNKPCGEGRKFCWAEFDFSEVQAIRAAGGSSVNDVILTVLTLAIAKYVQLHGQTVESRLIRIVCPVNRRQDNGGSLGNQISFMPVVLPLDVKDPVRLLEAVAARTALMKKSRAADFVTLAAGCIGVAPPPVQAMLWQSISQVTLPLPLFNMICTNIPGPTEPLYCTGRRLLACYPQVPTGYDLGINCAALTYCGKLFFGLIADAGVAGDVRRLRDFLGESFDELCVASGVRKSAQSGATSRSSRPARTGRSRPAAADGGEPRRRKRARRTETSEPIAAPPREPAPAPVVPEALIATI